MWGSQSQSAANAKGMTLAQVVAAAGAKGKVTVGTGKQAAQFTDKTKAELYQDYLDGRLTYSEYIYLASEYREKK